jgi:tetratricopeptide (TPR) repeat protein
MAEVEDLVALVREARPNLAHSGPETEAWLSRLEERHDHLCELLDRLFDEEPPTAAAICAALWPLWWQRGHMSEGRDLLERAALVEGASLPAVLKGLGTIAFRQGDLERAAGAFGRRFEMLERGGSPSDLVDACADLARVALRRGDFGEVRKWAERGCAVADGLDDLAATRLPLHMRAAAARMQGAYEEARELYLRSIEVNEELGNEMAIAAENHNLFYVALHTGDREEARRRFQLASSWIFANDNAYLRPYALLDAGVLALSGGDAERACLLIACARQIFEQTNSMPDPDDHVELENAVATLRERLGRGFDRAWGEGQALGIEEAQALARA